ncbi:MAG TPA: hypothetical protein VKM55_00650 [Candidatus Lokiarchaeia archaeon]|nr:hypothetical protein [Candidatus Lokiarchaeia archaeon]
MGRESLCFKEKLLLALFFDKEHKSNITRLMKLLFFYDEIFKMKNDQLEELHFIRHLYGPWAENFDVLVSPLVIGDLITDQEMKQQRVIAIDGSKRNQVLKVIQEEYIDPVDISDNIYIIKFFSEHYGSDVTQLLIQLVYFLRPEFATKSVIRDQIEKLPREKNINVILEFIQNAPKQVLIEFLQNETTIKGLLKLFIEPDIDVSEHFIVDIIKISTSGYIDPNSYTKQEMLSILYEVNKDNVSGENIYEPFVTALIAIISLFEIHWNDKEFRSFITFILNVLQLNWPLTSVTYEEFQNQISIFKKKSELGSFFNGITPLSEDVYQNSINEFNEDEISTIEKNKKRSISLDLKKSIKKNKNNQIVRLDDFFDDFNEDDDRKNNQQFDETYTQYEETST